MEPTKARWIESLITMALSAVASALAATWVVSAKVASIDAMLKDHQRHIDHTEDLISQASKYGAATNEHVQVETTEVTDIKERLSRIERKLDKEIAK
jgi:septal ring factor EnvC (AmiA/AmiB activator)